MTHLDSKINKYASADAFFTAVAESMSNLEASLPQQTENIAVTANEDSGEDKENKMEELEKEGQGCASTAATEPENVEVTAAKEEDKPAEEPKAKEEDKKEDDKAADKKDGEEKKDEKKEEGKAEEVKVSKQDFKHAEDLLNKVLANEQAEAAGGEEESEDIKNLKEALKLLGAEVKEPKPEEGLGEATMPEVPAAEPVMEETVEEETINPFASLTATLDKKATAADSIWMIKTAKDNSDYLTFSVKAAFGENIDKNPVMKKYAMSEEFGKAVIAALINEKVASATGAKAAVLGVVAHYSPAWPSASEFKDFEAANPGKSGTKVPAEDDKNIPSVEGKKAKAAAEAPLTKTAAEGTEKVATDAVLFPTPTVTEKVNTKLEQSATPHATTQVPAESDRKLVASYEAQIQKQAAEIQALKLEASIKEKAAKVKEAVNLMARAGLIKANQEVRVAALKDGLSIEAANAKAMAASIDTQSKNLFGMNTPQLDAYIRSLAELSPRGTKVQASDSMSPLTVKASAPESEEERLSKLLGWN